MSSTGDTCFPGAPQGLCSRGASELTKQNLTVQSPHLQLMLLIYIVGNSTFTLVNKFLDMVKLLRVYI